MGTVYEDVCVCYRTNGQAYCSKIPPNSLHYGHKILKYTVVCFFFKYCQIIHITAFCILSPRRKYEFNNHLHCVLCHIMTFFKYQLEEHYQYCYTGLYTRSHSDISLAFDISREETQDLAFISVLEDFARPRA